MLSDSVKLIILSTIMMSSFAKCRYSEVHYAACRYSYRHYAECHYTVLLLSQKKFFSVVILSVMAPLAFERFSIFLCRIND